MAHQVGPSTTHLAESAAEPAGITKLLNDHRRVAGMIDPMPGIAEAISAIQKPAYTRLLDAMKPSAAYASVVQAMKPSAA